MKNRPLRGMLKNKPLTSVYYFALIVLIVSTLVMYFFGCTKSQISDLRDIPVIIQENYYPLSETNNKSHLTAKKLNESYKKTGKGLDDRRYQKKYSYEVKINDADFRWEVYKKVHPEDVVIFDDNVDKIFYVYTDEIDNNIFSPITYAYK